MGCICAGFRLCQRAGASLAATVVVIFLSRAAAVVNRCPVTPFLISGIFPPGAWSRNLLDRLLPGDGTAGAGCAYGNMGL